MSEGINLDKIEPGMVVYGADGAEIGPVESVHQLSIRVASHDVPQDAITRVDGEGVHLQVAKIAFMARRDKDVEGVSGPDPMATTMQAPGTVREDDGTPAFDQARPHFEDHFLRRQQERVAQGGATSPAQEFQTAEPYYRAGFSAGHDPRHTGRSFEDVAEDLQPPRPGGTGAGDEAAWEELHQQLRAGFEYARTPRA